MATNNKERLTIAIIGFGRMGQMLHSELKKSEDWYVKYIYDTEENQREIARQKDSDATVTDSANVIFDDAEVDVVAIYALSDSRAEYVARCVAARKHIIAEKPVGVSRDEEAKLLELVEGSGLLATVNLYLRNCWFVQALKDFAESGEIGDLAIIRICHNTPGLAPSEGHEAEGPSFHDCGMHYVDIARWYADSEYKTWSAQGIRMWAYKDPWYLQVSGTFSSGVVYDITQGHVYGQLSKDQSHVSYIELIGTKGTARMTHDFKTAVVDLRGVTVTERIERAYGSKSMDVLLSRFAESVRSGELHRDLPNFGDAVDASARAWDFLDDARSKDLPVRGTNEELEAILHRRRTLRQGYGLIHNYKKL